jgi:hypothetical protein
MGLMGSAKGALPGINPVFALSIEFQPNINE